VNPMICQHPACPALAASRETAGHFRKLIKALEE